MKDGYTGHLFEEEVLGHCRVKWSGEMRYSPFWKAVRLAKKTTPWDPSDPEIRIANDLHAQVAMALDLDDFSSLKLFSAVGTPLDRFHGIDGFFEFEGRMVTIDLTVNPNKVDGKADLIVHPEDLEDLPQLASAIVECFAGEGV